jgi:hypothetical protein
MRKSRK